MKENRRLFLTIIQGDFKNYLLYYIYMKLLVRKSCESRKMKGTQMADNLDYFSSLN
jgi:hypothetical protein